MSYLVTFHVSKRNARKLPIAADTADMVQDFLLSGKHTTSEYCESSVRTYLDNAGVFFRITREGYTNPPALLECGHAYNDDCLCGRSA